VIWPVTHFTAKKEDARRILAMRIKQGDTVYG